MYHSNYFKCIPSGMLKNLPGNAREVADTGLTPESGRSPGGGNGNPLQYSYLANPMDRGSWLSTVIGFRRVTHD